MKRVHIFGLGVLLAVTAISPSTAQDSSKLCLASFCYAPTLEAFREGLPEGADYLLRGLKKVTFLQLNEPAYINDKAFDVMYGELNMMGKDHFFLKYEYKFSARTEMMCEDRYAELLATLHDADYSLRPEDAMKPEEGWVSERIQFENGYDTLRTLEINGKTVFMKNVGDITPDVSLEVGLSEQSRSSKVGPMTLHPSCQLTIIMRRIED